jgi:hypothetical protein
MAKKREENIVLDDNDRHSRRSPIGSIIRIIQYNNM